MTGKLFWFLPVFPLLPYPVCRSGSVFRAIRTGIIIPVRESERQADCRIGHWHFLKTEWKHQSWFIRVSAEIFLYPAFCRSYISQEGLAFLCGNHWSDIGSGSWHGITRELLWLYPDECRDADNLINAGLSCILTQKIGWRLLLSMKMTSFSILALW